MHLQNLMRKSYRWTAPGQACHTACPAPWAQVLWLLQPPWGVPGRSGRYFWRWRASGSFSWRGPRASARIWMFSIGSKASESSALKLRGHEDDPSRPLNRGFLGGLEGISGGGRLPEALPGMVGQPLHACIASAWSPVQCCLMTFEGSAQVSRSAGDGNMAPSDSAPARESQPL